HSLDFLVPVTSCYVSCQSVKRQPDKYGIDQDGRKACGLRITDEQADERNHHQEHYRGHAVDKSQFQRIHFRLFLLTAVKINDKATDGEEPARETQDGIYNFKHQSAKISEVQSLLYEKQLVGKRLLPHAVFEQRCVTGFGKNQFVDVPLVNCTPDIPPNNNRP